MDMITAKAIDEHRYSITRVIIEVAVTQTILAEKGILTQKDLERMEQLRVQVQAEADQIVAQKKDDFFNNDDLGRAVKAMMDLMGGQASAEA